MVTLQASQIEPWLATVVLPWCRVVGWIISDPLWGHNNISRRIKLLLSVAMTWALLPSLKNATLLPPQEWLSSIAQQLFIGIAIGFSVRIIFGAVNLAGQMISTQMGLGFATLYDNHNSQSSPVVGELMTWIILIILWTSNSPVAVWMVLADSFEWIPIHSSFTAQGIPPLLGLGALLFQWGAIMALPLVIQILFLNLSFGMLNRLAPSLNLLSLSFPATLLAGLLMLWVTQPIWQELTPRWISMVLETLRHTLPMWKGAP